VRRQARAAQEEQHRRGAQNDLYLAWQIEIEGEDAADTVGVRSDLVNLLLGARRLRRAEGELAPALCGLERAQMQGSMVAASLHANAALLERNQGRLLDADQNFRIALEAIERRGIHDARYVTVAINHVSTLAPLDQRDAARERFAQAVATARAVAPHLLLAAHWQPKWGDRAAALALLDEVDAISAGSDLCDPALPLRAGLLRALATQPRRNGRAAVRGARRSRPDAGPDRARRRTIRGSRGCSGARHRGILRRTWRIPPALPRCPRDRIASRCFESRSESQFRAVRALGRARDNLSLSPQLVRH
jgi:hypothetical protein